MDIIMASKLTPIEILEKLVAFPTVSCDTNLPLVDWVEDYLNSHDILSRERGKGCDHGTSRP